MSQEVFLRGICSGIIAMAFAWMVFSRYDHEIGSESTDEEGQKYLPYVNGAVLPVCLLTLTVLAFYEYGEAGAVRVTLSGCFSIFLQICLYYLVLLALLPFLRKIISARACATLWLIPNYLYVLFFTSMELPRPLFVITAPGKSAFVLFGIWFAGFAGIMIWKTAEHVVFRHRILKNARPVCHPDVTAVWETVISDARIRKPKFKLVTSPDVSTPLTIGLLQRATRVILPERVYEKEDLELILRHEIIHIGRGDAWNKFFMVFCAAMCWFNPIVWIALRKSANDLELSCDETVLLNTDDATRKQYALLLLDTAGDERGFTTCLSATASAMRYRLRNITKPGKRHCGALIVGAAFFLLCMTSGYLALAYNADSGAQRLYQRDDYSGYSIRTISKHDYDLHTQFEILDEQAFHDYLAGLTVYELTGNYSFSNSQRYYFLLLDSPSGSQAFTLYDDTVKLVWLNQLNRPAEYYYVPGGLDWDYIDRLIIPHPSLDVHFDWEDSMSDAFQAHLAKLWKTENGEKTLIHDGEYPGSAEHGLYGYAPWQAGFTFSHELSKPFTVLVESWDYSDSFTVSQNDLSDGYTMDLPDYPAHYTVSATFQNTDGSAYEAEFRFNIGALGNE